MHTLHNKQTQPFACFSFFLSFFFFWARARQQRCIHLLHFPSLHPCVVCFPFLSVPTLLTLLRSFLLLLACLGSLSLSLSLAPPLLVRLWTSNGGVVHPLLLSLMVFIAHQTNPPLFVSFFLLSQNTHRLPLLSTTHPPVPSFNASAKAVKAKHGPTGWFHVKNALLCCR